MFLVSAGHRSISVRDKFRISRYSDKNEAQHDYSATVLLFGENHFFSTNTALVSWVNTELSIAVFYTTTSAFIMSRAGLESVKSSTQAMDGPVVGVGDTNRHDSLDPSVSVLCSEKKVNNLSDQCDARFSLAKKLVS